MYSRECWVRCVVGITRMSRDYNYKSCEHSGPPRRINSPEGAAAVVMCLRRCSIPLNVYVDDDDYAHNAPEVVAKMLALVLYARLEFFCAGQDCCLARVGC